jgi:hypothetical protein
MYFGIGGKTEPNAQQGSHIMNNIGRDNGPVQVQRPVVDTHQEVQAFQRKLQFENLKREGMTAPRAAQRVGTNVPLGANLTPKDITQIIQTGKLQRRRI